MGKRDINNMAIDFNEIIENNSRDLENTIKEIFNTEEESEAFKMKNFEDIKILNHEKKQQDNILIDYYITSEPLGTEEREILARWDKSPKDELTIILDKKASESMDTNKIIELVIREYRENRFLKLKENQAIFKGILKA